MNTPKDLDQLLNNTKKLPLEMDLARIDTLVAAFPDHDPPSGGFRAPHVLTITIVALAAALLLLLAQRPGQEPPRLAAAFPVAAEEGTNAPGTEVPAEVVADEPVASDLVEPPTEKLTVPTAPVPAPKPTLAPAAAPNSPKRPAGASGPASTNRPPATPPAPITPPFGEPTVIGTYSVLNSGEQHGQRIILESEERVNGRKITWMLPLDLSGEERRVWEEMPARGAYLERETGRLFVKPGGRTSGTFTFQPRLPVQQRYEERGWGTGQVPAAAVKLVGMQQGVSLRPEVFTNAPADITWLRYYTNRVGDRYLEVLGELGVLESELDQLWQLPNSGVSLGGLNSLNQLLDRLLYVRDGGLTVETIVRLNRKRELLRELSRQGYTGVTGTEIETLLAADVSDYYLTRINLHRNDNFSLPKIGALAAAGVSVHDANKFHQAFGRDLSVRELTELTAAEVSPYSTEVFFELGLRNITPAELIAAQAADLSPYDVRRMQENGLNLASLSDYLAVAEAGTQDEPESGSANAEEAGLFLVDKDFARKKGSWKREIIDLSPFDRLRVEGEISVVVVPGDSYGVELLYPGFKGLSIDLDVDDRGELTVRKRVKFGWSIKMNPVAEIRLTVPHLEAVKTRGDARVWVMEGMPAVKGAGRALEDR